MRKFIIIFSGESEDEAGMDEIIEPMSRGLAAATNLTVTFREILPCIRCKKDTENRTAEGQPACNNCMTVEDTLCTCCGMFTAVKDGLCHQCEIKTM